MKRILSHSVLALLVLIQIVPAFVWAQQRPQVSPSTSSRTSAPPANAARKPGRNISAGTAAIERDFDEALRVVEEQYIDGRKLNYNEVFKSSIIGMLRSLDPHSNYYDRQEFDELKTDQRSEYFGIGASIQSYIRADQIDTYISATFEYSPAARAGLRFGDRIVEVDGVKMTGKSSLEVRDKI